MLFLKRPWGGEEGPDGREGRAQWQRRPSALEAGVEESLQPRQECRARRAAEQNVTFWMGSEETLSRVLSQFYFEVD